jgi:rhamnose utilization protein RhaD (predicted bifunctional aldolase and dehydrogenase)
MLKAADGILKRLPPRGFTCPPESSEEVGRATCLSDSEMVNEMVTHLAISSAPVPSVEAILHAVIPYKYVDHTHADAIVAISNS